MTAEMDFAWELAQEATPQLSPGERTAIYVHLGAGDAVKAIQALMNALVEVGGTLTPTTARRVHQWLNLYHGCDFESSLRALINATDVLPLVRRPPRPELNRWAYGQQRRASRPPAVPPTYKSTK